MQTTNTYKGSPSIMLIDDNEIDLFINQKLIELVYPNSKIIVFKRGTDALNYLKSTFTKTQTTLEFILLDLYMPITDGFDFLKEYQLITLKLKDNPSVIVLTCSIDPKDRSKCSEYNSVTAFVSKPLTKIVITNHLVRHKFSTICGNSV